MAVIFNEAGIAEVDIGGHCDIVRTGEQFQREFEYQDECGVPRDFTDLTVESAIVYDPITLAALATIDVTIVAPPTDGKLLLAMANGVVPAAGEWFYRCRFTETAVSTPLRTVQEGRFTIGVSPP